MRKPNCKKSPRGGEDQNPPSLECPAKEGEDSATVQKCFGIARGVLDECHGFEKMDDEIAGLFEESGFE